MAPACRSAAFAHAASAAAAAAAAAGAAHAPPRMLLPRARRRRPPLATATRLTLFAPPAAPPLLLQSPWKTASFRCALYPPAAAPVLVDGPAALATAAFALGRCSLFGVDTETKPVFDKGAPAEPPALLQIAGMQVGGGAGYGGRDGGGDGISSGPSVVTVPPTVYVFDLLRLVPEHPAKLSAVLSPLLSSPISLLLGVGIAADLRALSRSYGSEVPCFAARVRGVQDLSAVVGTRQKQGLRQLAEHFAGLQLPKRQARSNWARRPLRAAQLEYAANDARAALAIYRAAGPEVFTTPVQELDLSRDAVWVCRVCQREFYSRRALRRACEASCGVVRSEEKRLTYQKVLHLGDLNSR
jgi:3'-5' exonuclease